MSEERPLRDKDWAVLEKIGEGYDDVQKITAETTLENHEVNYCFTKLEGLGLITVYKPEGYTERIVDGQKRVFRAPKQARLTGRAVRWLEAQSEEVDEYEEMSRRELAQRVRAVETRLEQLETEIRGLKQFIRNKL